MVNKDETPRLLICGSFWSMGNYPSPENPFSVEQKVEAIQAAGFDAFTGRSNLDNQKQLKRLVQESGLRFGGAFDADCREQIVERIALQLEVDNGPINCQLCDHDTPVEEGIELAITLMEEAERQHADVYLEMHRDTCTETPEKMYAIIDGYEKATGKKPKVNFDYSHSAIVKHLNPKDYTERLLIRPDLQQMGNLWHMRPFNGHHCQIPITDGKGSLSPEFEDIKPFILDVLKCWLSGPRPNNELWVVPELGPYKGYGLSCFPPIWEDAIVLGNQIRELWNEALNDFE